MKSIDPEAFLRALFERAVEVADPMACVPAALPDRPAGRIVVIGAGKASARMAEAVEGAWGPCEGLVITRYGYERPLKGLTLASASHPVPDEAGVAASDEMLDLLGSLGEHDFVLALISGGGSALLCAPADGLSLDDKKNVTRMLLESGAPIGEMNGVRKALSRVKGGGLAAAAHPARMLALMISDVPGDDPGDIASGPTVASPVDAARALETLTRWGINPPPSVSTFLRGGGTALAMDDPRLSRVENRVIAAPSQSLSAAAEMARAAGVQAEILGDAIEGEAADLARDMVAVAKARQADLHPGEAVVLLSGGECTVTHRGTGVGGPNAEFVLASAIELNGAAGIHVLACDTDGVDGAAEVAGAYAGPDILEQAARKGEDAHRALDIHDSHGFFERVESQVVTGPTLTNVNDFRALLVLPRPDPGH